MVKAKISKLPTLFNEKVFEPNIEKKKTKYFIG